VTALHLLSYLEQESLAHLQIKVFRQFTKQVDVQLLEEMLE
jgi:hypothetical protein